MSARLNFLAELIVLVICVALLLLWHYSRDAIRTFAGHDWLWLVLPPLAIIWAFRHTRWARGLRRQLGNGEEKVIGRRPASPRITEGITIGVTSGLILSAFFWTGSCIEDRRIRDQQLYNLWRTIEYHREDLLGPDKSEQWTQIIHHTNIKWESVPAMSSRIRGLRDTHRKRSRAAVGETLSWFSTPP